MPDPTPGEIHVRRRELTVLRRVLMAAEPREGCALLLGDLLRPGAPAAPPPSTPAGAPPRSGAEPDG